MTSSTTLRFGADHRDISPARPVWMAGYANRNRRSDGVLHPIQVSTLALAVGESAPILVVTFDLVGIHTAQIARIYAAINEATGVDPQRILIACSHTHFAPSSTAARCVLPSGRPVMSFPCGAWVKAAGGSAKALRRRFSSATGRSGR